MNEHRLSLLEETKGSVSIRNFSRLLVTASVFIFLSLCILPWQQTVSGYGRVVAYAPLDRQQFIEAPIDGRIVHWHVQEGSNVKKDDLIVEISDNDPMFLQRLQEEKSAIESRIAAVKARSEAIQARIRSLEGSVGNSVSAAKSRTRMARDRIDASEHALEAAAAVYRTASINSKRQKTLFAQGLASQRAVETSEMEEARALTDLNRAKAAVSSSKSELLALQSDQSKAGTDGSASIEDAKASYAAALAELASAQAELPRISARLSRQHSQTVRAPRDGTVMRLIVSQDGEMVKTGEPLVILIPDAGDRAAEIWIDGNHLPLLSEGREARIQFQGWPVLQFSGWPDMSFGTFAGKVILVDSTDNGTGRFRILIKPTDGSKWPDGKYLRQGVRAFGWIFLNRVSLGYEIWRRFNDFPPEIPGMDLKEPKKKEKK
ncbi:MAG TPA: HlyD family efflux transporter periplasmic adaptor subunit [Leptospiraceae bacterium]|nr:HlyD family efflux transporter periplasmic adaptor subunit [Leptospiraceae bacterium]HNF23206.1 HlyD family efflux transporter periplasmic adaptor subunit [Leptospiraceae bacterium]HNM03291.1 HlyD family efflux transporter periplasmic adaptor subunit [Leptospiraceae bacterium]HNN05896.1 HlyD family efflux transporter periplasmic adaptor subunit [Leptospiraceae bacterium]HNO21776.1 HlyD family efflux transporter periplasmic adaptor subunit [Leptospiraceae bacterium]